MTSLSPIAGLEQAVAALMANAAAQPATAAVTAETAPETTCEFPELFGDLAEMDVTDEPAPVPEKRKDLLFVPVLITPLPAPPPPPIDLEPELTAVDTAPIEAAAAATELPVIRQVVNLRAPVVEQTAPEEAAPVLIWSDLVKPHRV